MKTNFTCLKVGFTLVLLGVTHDLMLPWVNGIEWEQ